MPDAAVENLAIVWRSIGELCAGLSDEEWERATACPGWSVKDQLSHLLGPEAMFIGRPQPTAVEFRPPHVRNDIGAANEAAVAHRHSWAGNDVLAEFEEVIGERLSDLRGMSDEDLAEDSWTPVGPGTYRDLLLVRAFDAWVHEQDIRAALGRPGHLEGPVARLALERCFLAMPFVVGKKAAAPEGSTVVIDITGPTDGRLGILVEGRARVVDPPPDSPTSTITAEFLQFTRLGCGRADPAAALAGGGGVTVAGDRSLGEAIVRNLAFMI